MRGHLVNPIGVAVSAALALPLSLSLPAASTALTDTAASTGLHSPSSTAIPSSS
ncbi:hypothetical protein SSCG_04198 [Streptomyces clavuligerus]|nr:hypothetical protein SSCG_04198 [Streptomyces clavuligerus]